MQKDLENSYEKGLERAIKILYKLLNNETFNIKDLVLEFNVSLRTIQRDMHRMQSLLPLHKKGGTYKLDLQDNYGKNESLYKNLRKFASISGITHLYPKLEDDFLNDLLNEKINHIFLVNELPFEKRQIGMKRFRDFSLSILSNKKIACDYNKKRRELEPYKLFCKDGVWYLLASEENKLKTFTLSKITNLVISDETFKVNTKLVDAIEKNKGNWFSNEEKIKVVLEIQNQAREYFLRKKVFFDLRELQKSENSFFVECSVTFEDELFNIIKQWIPYIKIIEPKGMQEKLNETLLEYVKNTRG